MLDRWTMDVNQLQEWLELLSNGNCDDVKEQIIDILDQCDNQ